MHVAHIIPVLNVGGAELALLRLVSTPPQDGPLGTRHTVITMRPNGTLEAAFAAVGVAVVCLNFGQQPLRSFWALCQWLRQHRPQLVNTWMTYANVVGGLAARLGGVSAVVWGIRQASIYEVATTPLQRLMYEVAARLSHWVPKAIVCVAEAARHVHEDFGYRADIMHVVGNGFDTLAFDPQLHNRASARALHGFDDSQLVIGHLGRYCEEKDHLNFLKAARLALDGEPALRFVMAGRDVNADNAALKSALHELRLQDHVRLLGERSDMPALLRSFDLFCLSSKFEGFPNVLGEAMSMALPCVSTDAGGARELAGDAAQVVPCADAPALGQALLSVARQTQAQRHEQGTLARRRIESLFSMHSMQRKFDAVFRIALSAQTHQPPTEGTPHVRHHRPPAS
jgi:glycosyltransferase involved in cell wall biosynthesis